MDDDKIFLHVRQRENGMMEVFDQGGRQLHGIRRISFHNEMDGVASISMEVLDFRDGKAWTPGRKEG